MSESAAQGRLHGFIVAATNDPTINRACVQNAGIMDSLLLEMARLSGRRPEIRHFVGDDFTKKAVETALGVLQVADNDVIVFYYSGHGKCESEADNTTRDRRMEFPVDVFWNTKEVEAVLIKKKAGLIIIAADCCSEMLRSSDSEPVILPGRKSPEEDFAKEVKTLLSYRGVVKLVSSLCGERSFCYTNGGFFTRNFARSWREFLDEENLDNLSAEQLKATWKQLLEKIKIATQSAAKEKMRIQHPDSLVKYN